MCVSFMEQKGTNIQPTYIFFQPKTTPNFISIPLTKVSLEKETLKSKYIA